MSFVFRKDYTFIHKVEVSIPGGDLEDFDATFAALDQSDLDALIAEGDGALLRRVLIGWDRIQGDDGVAILFSAAAREALIARPYARYAAAKAYLEALSGLKRGN